MAQISTIGSGVYTSLSHTSAVIATKTETALEAGTYSEVSSVREFPTFGTPANIVNVPVYGQSVSTQVTAQADAPTLEVTLNYVPGNSSHISLEALRTAGTVVTWRISLQNDSNGTDISSFYFDANVASFTVTPSLSDSNQATVTLALQSDFFGPFGNA